MDQFRKYIEFVPTGVTVVYTFALGFSVVFDLGYFSIIGSKYLNLLSVADHLSSAVLWLVPISIVFGWIYLINRILKFSVGRVRSETSVKSRDEVERSLSIRMPFWFLVFFVLFQFVFFGLTFPFFVASNFNNSDISFFSTVATGFTLFLMMIGSFVPLFLLWTEVNPRVADFFRDLYRSGLIFSLGGVVILMSTYFAGRAVALLDASELARSYEFSVLNDAGIVEKHAYKFLRSYDGGEIVFDSDVKRVIALPDNRIVSVQGDWHGEDYANGFYSWVTKVMFSSQAKEN